MSSIESSVDLEDNEATEEIINEHDMTSSTRKLNMRCLSNITGQIKTSLHVLRPCKQFTYYAKLAVN